MAAGSELRLLWPYADSLRGRAPPWGGGEGKGLRCGPRTVGGGRHRPGARGLQDRPDPVRGSSVLARLDPRPGFPSPRPLAVALLLLLVVAASEGPAVARLRSVHPLHGYPLPGVVLPFGFAM